MSKRIQRTEEERVNNLRPRMNMHYQDKLYIDPALIPDDMEYYWVRVSFLNQPDTSRMTQMQRKGWTPVPAARHPDYAIPDFFGRLDRFSGYIHQDGLVLCECNKNFVQEEVDEYNRIIYDQLISMPGTENFLGEPSIPTRFTGDTYLSKSVSFGK